MKNSFDARRRNLGSAPVSDKADWRKRVMIGGSVLGALVALTAAAAIWHSLTHVTTVRAWVSAAVRELSTDVDARMLDLHVSPGDKVKAGQSLARLDDSALRAGLKAAEAEVAIKTSSVAQAEANETMVAARIEADIMLARARIEMARKRVDGAKTMLEILRQKVPEEVRRARAYRNEAAAHLEHLRKGARKEQVEMARARLATAKSREALRLYQVKQTEALVERRVESPLDLEVVKTELSAQQNAAREAELALEQLLAGPTTEQVEAAKQALEAREAALTLVRSRMQEIPVAEGDLAIREAELEETQTALTQAETKRHELAVAKESVKAAQAALLGVRADADQSRALLERMTIYSPVTGTVIQTYGHEGEVCRKGEAIIQVTDDSKGFWIEGRVREDDAGLLAEGQSAQVEIILGSGDYVRAVVEAVGLSTSRSDRTVDLTASYGAREMVYVRLTPLEKLSKVRHGMTARAVIRVRGGQVAPFGAAAAETGHQ